MVVVACNGDRWIPACVASLREAGGVQDMVLVDNGGNESLERYAANGAQPVLGTRGMLGFAEANNFALAHSRLAETVCFLNQDTVSGPGWLDACLEVLATQADVAAVTPLLLNAAGDAWDEGFRDCIRGLPDFDAAPDFERGYDQVYDVPRASAAALVVRTRVLLEVGPFDPLFGSYYEDYDLCRRIREQGHRIVVCGGAWVRHYGGSVTTDPAAVLRRRRAILRNRVIHRLRLCGGKRLGRMMGHYCIELPRNILRSIVRTPSSAPLRALLGAEWDLLRLWPRLMSERFDRRCWNQYLSELGWPPEGPPLK